MPYFAVWPLLSSSSSSAASKSNATSPPLHKRVNCVEVSPSGQYFATGDWGSNVIVWDVMQTRRTDWHTTGFFEIYLDVVQIVSGSYSDAYMLRLHTQTRSCLSAHTDTTHICVISKLR